MYQLKALRELFEDYATDIQDALWQDIGKSAAQTDQTEFAPVKDEIAYAILHLTDWMEPESRSIPIALRPARARVRARPLGTVGIIGHCALPFYTLLAPLVDAIAAGICVLLKPSMRAPKTCELLGTILPEYLTPRSIVTVTGGADALEELASQPLDHLFYSGSTDI